MSEHDRGQVAASAADIYERFFVPALFAEWPARILAAADVRPGQRVLDVASGTGILAREAARIVGTSGAVVGLDINPGMLAVAQAKSDDVSWQQAAAESLPFDADSFDRVVSQFGLMFFEDRLGAISEMLRVLRRGGTACVAVWAALDDTPGYAAVAQMLRDLFGADVAKAIEAPYCLGDTRDLSRLFAAAGAGQASVHTVPGTARFTSIDAWLYTDIKGWTLADVIDDADYERLKQAARQRLSQFVQPDGSVTFPAPAHLVTVAA